MTIYIGNLSYQATEADLESVFSDYGRIKNISIPVDRESGRPRGFAFVEMWEVDAEDKAIEALNEAEWMGRQLRVNKARPREERKSNFGGGRRNNRGGYRDRF
ncbi:RNA-binding protein [Geitlerinema sp. PCC 9228]|uniref:RNA recognition motif domain-containing protein n=1 Tax=Geitlerinema sp. PCC 9228 TaxID=111611 RepID=UPI0008F9A92C|nr:RNA-binding protein [Geitlerinema sp. PCC 9228]